MAAGGGSGGAGRRPIAAAGGSICYSHGRDLAPAGPAQPPQPREQPQVRPRRSRRAAAAAAALTWSCGLRAGFRTAPSAGSRVRPAERRRRRRGEQAPDREDAPPPRLPANAVRRKKETLQFSSPNPLSLFPPFSSLKPFSGQTARCTVASQITSLIRFCWAVNEWPCSPGVWERTGGRR